MASASEYKGPYDVFLSFRGPDSRHAIISHIYKALDRGGIYTFKDDVKLSKGEALSSAFPKAVEGSRIAVIIFTRDFAASPWCLREVDKIMERKRTNNLLVLPVFYCVDPREVSIEYKEALDGHEKKYRKEYEEALHRHEKECKEALDAHEKEYKEALQALNGHGKEYKEVLEKYRKEYKEALAISNQQNLEEVKRWKQALLDAGSLYESEFTVWVVEEGTTIQLENRDTKVKKFLRIRTTIQTGGEFRNEAELVESIVREIWVQLKPTPLDIGGFRVGIDSRVDELIVKFNLKSKENTLKLGLWAIGGMGKTTLAKALYNSIFKDFDGSAYVDGIKTTKPETEAMVRLQKSLLSQMLIEKEIILGSDAAGKTLIKERLCRKRVLLILDGVDDQCQIDSLARDHDWFGVGSKIIFTTTDKLLLNKYEVSSHTVQRLEDSEARELFMNHARENGHKIIGESYICKALQCTHGVPLALKVLGGDFAASEEKEWEGRLTKFATSSSETIDKVLEVCYEGLPKDDRKIFLDIACFFNGWSRRYVEGVLKKRDPSVGTIVKNLIRRSLIEDENGILKVHELIELMGKNIVDEQRHGVARRSRLWRLKDVDDVLSGNEESDEVNAIVLALPKLETIKIHPGAFEKLRNLKFLIMINVEADTQDPICLPRGLSWFEWPKCSASNLQLTPGNDLTVLAVRRHLFDQPEEP